MSDKSATIARIDDLAAGGGVAALAVAWQLDDLKGKPEGLAFTASGRAIVALDTRKARRNLVLLEPAIASAQNRAKGAKAGRARGIASLRNTGQQRQRKRPGLRV
jgi:hypothetical protein